MIDSNKATAIRTVVIVSLRLVWHSPTTNRCPQLANEPGFCWSLQGSPPGFPGSATFRLCNSEKLRKSPPQTN